VPEPLDGSAIVASGVAEVDRRGWDRGVVVVGDEFAIKIAVSIARERADVVQGVALGHACLSFRDDSGDAPVAADIMSGFNRLLETDYRSWVRAYTQITQGAYDDDTMQRFLERVPPDVAKRHSGLVDELSGQVDLEGDLRTLNVPLLFAEHRDCLVFRREGFAAAVEAFAGARTVTTHEKPSCSPDFDRALRSFCDELVAPEVLGG
jgi:hypothetical protein